MSKGRRGKFLFIVLQAITLVGTTNTACALLWPIDPQTSKPDIPSIFGDWNGDRLHDGIDFQELIGTDVKSIEGGVVIQFLPRPGTDDGVVVIGTSQNATEGWSYGHLDFPPGVFAILDNSFKTGAFISSGTIIGSVTNFDKGGANDTFDHLHLERADRNAKSVPKNPFGFYAASELPVQDAILDPAKIFFVPDKGPKSQAILPIGGRVPLKGDIDILVEGHNKAGIFASPGVYRISYNALNAVGATAIAERTLAVFNEFPFTAETNNPATGGKFGIIYGPGSIDFKGLYVVTNTGDQAPATSDGTSNALESAWFTKAKSGVNDGAGPLTAAQMAASDAEAKYPDGNYTIGVRVKSFDGKEKFETRNAHVGNWRGVQTKTTIKKEDTGTIQRLMEWAWDSVNKIFKKVNPRDVAMGPGTYTIETVFSEPVVNPVLDIDTIGTLALTSSDPPENQKTFTATLVVDETTQDGRRTMTITAKDLGGDDLLAFGPDDTTIDPATQLARDASGNLLGVGGSATVVVSHGVPPITRRAKGPEAVPPRRGINGGSLPWGPRSAQPSSRPRGSELSEELEATEGVGPTRRIPGRGDRLCRS